MAIVTEAPAVKALTIRQPWADAIAFGTKRTENRTRRTHYRGVVFIHAGQQPDRAAVIVRDRAWTDARGVVLAIARIAGCHPANETGPLCCAPWGWPGMWHWQLEDVTPLTSPIAARGALGLWTPDADVLAAVQAQQTKETPDA